MPRVPTSNTQTGRISAAVVADPGRIVETGNVLAGVFKGASNIAFDAKKRVDDAKKEDLFIENLSNINKTITDLSIGSDDPDQFSAAANSAKEEILSGIEDEQVRRELNRRATVAIDSNRFSIAKALDQRQRSESRKIFATETIGQFSEAAAMAVISGNDVEADRNVSEFNDLLTRHPRFSDEEKKVMESVFNESMQKNQVQILIEKSLASPELADRSLAKASVLLGQEFTPDISPRDRLILRRSINSAQDSVETMLKERESSIESQQVSDLLVRFYDRKDGEPLPSVTEIASMDISDSKKEHFMLLREKHEAGAEIFTGDPAVNSEVFERVTDPSSENPITSTDELVSILGKDGLGLNMYKALAPVIEGKKRRQNAVLSASSRPLNQFFAQAKKMLIDPLLPSGDPIGTRQYSDFIVKYMPMFEEAILEGVPLEKLLSSKSDDPRSAWKILAEFQMTQREKMLEESRATLDLIRGSQETNLDQVRELDKVEIPEDASPAEAFNMLMKASGGL